jgi:GH25 family lysozyme M1 (1,4-beta-N-acetylmuramidase)
MTGVRSAQGRDYSSYQRPVDARMLDGLSFAYTRVSNWSGLTMGTDPRFAGDWAEIRAKGLHRGAYWFLLPEVDAAEQARYFVAAVRQQGIRPGDMLVCDSEQLAGNVDAATRAFCAEVDRLTAGDHVIVMVYTMHDVGQHLVSCTRWPLWFAWPSPVAPPEGFTAPWKDWAVWQWGIRGGVDADAFNGTPADMDAWIRSRIPAEGWRDYTTTGHLSLRHIADMCRTEPAVILQRTVDHDGGSYRPHLAAYLNAGDFAAPMPRGIILRVPPGSVIAPKVRLAGVRKAAGATSAATARAGASVRRSVRSEPVVTAGGVVGVLAAAAVFGLRYVGVHLTQPQLAAVVTIITALGALYAAARTRPVAVSGITGALATIATAAVAFGVHLSPAWLGTEIPVAALGIALLLRSHVYPKSAADALDDLMRATAEMPEPVRWKDLPASAERITPAEDQPDPPMDDLPAPELPAEVPVPVAGAPPAP